MAPGDNSETIQGIPLARGVAVGEVRSVDTAHFPARAPRHRIDDGDVEREIERLNRACEDVREDLEQLAGRIQEKLGKREADLLRAQAMMVDDHAFRDEVKELVRDELINVEWAVGRVVDRFEKMVADIEDHYLRERSTDIRDAGRRLLGKLLFVDGEVMPRLEKPAVVVASHLVPSLTLHLDRDCVLGFASEQGGLTSHAAIFARSLGVPAVSGLRDITERVVAGQTMVVDGFKGLVIVDPDEEELEEYRSRAEAFRSRLRSAVEHAGEPTVTRDGVHVEVMANVGSADELELARRYEADGVGLYRTEVDFLDRPSPPSEDELAEEYAHAVDLFSGQGVTFRALDIGGDKFPPAVPLAHEENPFIGLRGLRLLLEHVQDLMLPQLRAILRASTRGRTAVMYPMIASVADLEAARDVFDRALREVREAGHQASDDVMQGIMVEVPSCVPMLPELMAGSDFASVGTNDLVQYLLAADRNSERMVDAYDAYHPAVIRTLDTVYKAAEERDRAISVCGEVAGDACFLPILLGLGYRKISVNVGALPTVKGIVRGLDVRECRKLAEKALRAGTADQVRAEAERLSADEGVKSV